MKKNLFWRIVSRVFHPMSMPLWCVVLYYLLTPQPFIPLEAIYTAIVVAVATVVIPLPVLLVLKVSGKIESLSLPQTYERRLPLLLVLLLIQYLVLYWVEAGRFSALPSALGHAFLGAGVTFAVSVVILSLNSVRSGRSRRRQW